MSGWDQGELAPAQIQTAVHSLKKRQQRLSLLAVLSASSGLIGGIGLWLQQDLVYSFYGLAQQLQQLHVPVSVDPQIFSAQVGAPDYFFALFAWFAWLCLKITLSFCGAFLLIYLLKKIRFFYQYFFSFVKKFVAWLLAFILIWSGLSYVQSANQDQSEADQALTAYQSNLNDSQLAQLTEAADMPMAVKAYLLAQTALLHRPVDVAAATPYADYLIAVERSDKKFSRYGFQPEQLWSIQQQIYGQAMTPSTQALAPTVTHAQSVSERIQWLLVVVLMLIGIMTLILFSLAHYLKSRAIRIEQRLHS